MPEKTENLVGKICVCSVGRPAIVVGRQIHSYQGRDFDVWIGLGLDGKGTWASTNPCVIAEDGLEFHDKLFTRFGGKMSFNG